MSQESESAGMDQFARRYLLVLLVVAAFFLVWWVASWDSRVGELNDVLQADPVLQDYPYRFEVQSLEAGVATVSSPRSARVSVVQFLRIINTDLAQVSATDPVMMAAQDELVKVQSRVGRLLKEQESVSSVRWLLDTQWYANNGVYLDET
jgi:hypothetical protein